MARSSTASGAKGGAGCALTSLIVLNILLFIAVLIMCAIVFDSYADGGSGARLVTGSPAALMTLVFSFLAAAVGLTTMFMAAVHAGAWTESARYSTLAANLVTFALVALAFGFACKVADQKPYSGLGGIGNLMIAIIASDIFLYVSMWLYLVSLGIFKHDDHSASTGCATNTQPGAINNTHTT